MIARPHFRTVHGAMAHTSTSWHARLCFVSTCREVLLTYMSLDVQDLLAKVRPTPQNNNVVKHIQDVHTPVQSNELAGSAAKRDESPFNSAPVLSLEEKELQEDKVLIKFSARLIPSIAIFIHYEHVLGIRN